MCWGLIGLTASIMIRPWQKKPLQCFTIYPKESLSAGISSLVSKPAITIGAAGPRKSPQKSVQHRALTDVKKTE
jgi:hypothetical protein